SRILPRNRRNRDFHSDLRSLLPRHTCQRRQRLLIEMAESSSVPIRSREFEDCRPEFTGRDRTQYLLLAGLSAAMLLIARLLRRSADGVGTHRQLGLPPCAFLHFTGIPCPGCGLTTSVAHAARLQFYEAIITQPFGLLVFVLAVLSVPLSIYCVRRRLPW